MRARQVERLLWAVAGVLIAGMALSAQAPGPMRPGMAQHRQQGPMANEMGLGPAQGRFWNNPNVIKQLNLTDDQRKSMDNILLQHKEKLIDLQANLQRAELGMQPLMSADQLDEKAVTAQIDKVAAARAELEKANARFLLAVRMQLKPEQWKALKDMRANMAQQQNRPMQGPGQSRWRGGQGPMGRWNRGPGNGAPPPPQGAPAGTPQSMIDPGDGSHEPTAEVM